LSWPLLPPEAIPAMPPLPAELPPLPNELGALEFPHALRPSTAKRHPAARRIGASSTAIAHFSPVVRDRL
jgi:hypothetical protein